MTHSAVRVGGVRDFESRLPRFQPLPFLGADESQGHLRPSVVAFSGCSLRNRRFLSA